MDGRVAPTAARPDINGVGKEAGRRENCLSVAGDHLEGSAMDVHGVDEAVVGADEMHFQVSPTFTRIVSVAGYALLVRQVEGRTQGSRKIGFRHVGCQAGCGASRWSGASRHRHFGKSSPISKYSWRPLSGATSAAAKANPVLRMGA